MSDLVERGKARTRKVVYPTSDGQPMAETDLHRDLAVYTVEALKAYFADRPHVYVSGNNFVFYQEGEPGKRVSPDAYVVFGVEMRPRDSYMAWREDGKLPHVVFEFTSRKTCKEDTEVKRPLYEQVLRVPEYFLFDPTGDYLRPRFQGFRLVDGRYVPLEVVQGRLHSEQLGLDLVQRGEELRLYDPARQEWLLSPLEREQAWRAEAEARRAAEAEVQRRRAELDALRKQLRPDDK